jgi:hypothetical protein
MSRGRHYIEFEGLFSENVLGIFRVIRGFADLQDLVTISAPYVWNKGIEPETTFHLADTKPFIWPQIWLSNGRNG